MELAKKHKVGFYDLSNNGGIYLPDGTNIAEKSKPWWKFW
jgi:hypothetical protein